MSTTTKNPRTGNVAISPIFYTPAFAPYLAAGAYTSSADGAFFSWMTNYYIPGPASSDSPEPTSLTSPIDPNVIISTISRVANEIAMITTSGVAVPKEASVEVPMPYLATVALTLLLVLILGPGLVLVVGKVWRKERMMRHVKTRWLLREDEAGEMVEMD